MPVQKENRGDRIVRLLNDPDLEAAGIVGEVLALASVSPHTALDRFNRLVEELGLDPVLSPVLDARGQLDGVRLNYLVDTGAENGLVGLAAQVLQDGTWRRLQRCQQCSRWWLMKTKPGRFCSEDCRQRWWTPERRDEARRQQRGKVRAILKRQNRRETKRRPT